MSKVGDPIVPSGDQKPAAVAPSTADVIAPGHTFATVTDKISSITLARRTPVGWWLGFTIAFSITMLLFWSVGYLFMKGVGIWGINQPVARRDSPAVDRKWAGMTGAWGGAFGDHEQLRLRLQRRRRVGLRGNGRGVSRFFGQARQGR